MRELTEFEQLQVGATHEEQPLPTEAVTIEWEYHMIQDKTISGLTKTYEDMFLWEEMPLPLTIDGTDLVYPKSFNTITFTSKDGPKDRATGQSFNFTTLVENFVYANPNADTYFGTGGDAARAQHVNRTLIPEPGKIWPMRIKKYSFDGTTGEVLDIQYFVLEEIVGGSSPASIATGDIDRTTDGNNYKFPITDVLALNPIVWAPGTSHTATYDTPDTILPLGNDGDRVHLLTNAQEALYYQNQFVEAGIPEEAVNPYEDRAQARIDLAIALWGEV